jgi:PEGA domain
MYRVIAVVLASLALAACTSTSSDWLNAFKPGPVVETVQFESVPPGAEVKLSNGQTCRTPCALAIPHPESGGYDATFALNGFEPATEQIQLASMGDGSTQLKPNPVVAELAPTPPPPKPKKKIVRRKPAAKPMAKKPAAAKKPKPAPRAKPTGAAPPPPAQQQPANSPWPASPPPQQQ